MGNVRQMITRAYGGPYSTYIFILMCSCCAFGVFVGNDRRVFTSNGGEMMRDVKRWM